MANLSEYILLGSGNASEIPVNFPVYQRKATQPAAPTDGSVDTSSPLALTPPSLWYLTTGEAPEYIATMGTKQTTKVFVPDTAVSGLLTREEVTTIDFSGVSGTSTSITGVNVVFTNTRDNSLSDGTISSTMTQSSSDVLIEVTHSAEGVNPNDIIINFRDHFNSISTDSNNPTTLGTLTVFRTFTFGGPDSSPLFESIYGTDIEAIDVGESDSTNPSESGTGGGISKTTEGSATDKEKWGVTIIWFGTSPNQSLQSFTFTLTELFHTQVAVGDTVFSYNQNNGTFTDIDVITTFTLASSANSCAAQFASRFSTLVATSQATISVSEATATVTAGFAENAADNSGSITTAGTGSTLSVSLDIQDGISGGSRTNYTWAMRPNLTLTQNLTVSSDAESISGQFRSLAVTRGFTCTSVSSVTGGYEFEYTSPVREAATTATMTFNNVGTSSSDINGITNTLVTSGVDDILGSKLWQSIAGYNKGGVSGLGTWQTPRNLI